ncbi:cytochrome P450 6a9-like [Musca vetustissima]|uniref:cytochrome P450 6a9-like n=1 Tax=Musca vetustissima TaxID=27455 RepID=UPI002AB71DBB|nr:cytochrome P450 6a9-like [Musca vetustissima]
MTWILLTVLILLLAFHYLRRHFQYWQSCAIPSDVPNWIFGNFGSALTSKSLCQLFADYYEKYKLQGPFVGFYCFSQPTIFVVDPELIRRILITDFSKFNNHMMYCNEKDDPLTGQLFNLTGDRWRTMRQKLTPNFTSGKIKAMIPIIRKPATEFVQVLEEEILKTNGILNIPDFMNRFTSDITGSCSFGLEINSLRQSECEFRNMCHKALGQHRYGLLGYFVRLCFPKLSHRLHIKETLPEVERFFIDLVKDTVAYRENNSVRRNDFMDMLIDLKNGADGLSLKEVAAQAFLFMLAGYESTSSTLTYALYELAQNQEVQEKARHEVMEVLRRHNGSLGYECLRELVYLEQIMQETLRLYPIGYVLTRQALEDYRIPDYPQHFIKKGMPIFIPAGAIHRDERYFPQPTIFNPDNFNMENLKSRNSILNLSFGQGPRNCIGLRFAKMQTLIGLSLLLRKFKFSICNLTPIPLVYKKRNFMNYPEKSIYLKVEKIE